MIKVEFPLNRINLCWKSIPSRQFIGSKIYINLFILKIVTCHPTLRIWWTYSFVWQYDPRLRDNMHLTRTLKICLIFAQKIFDGAIKLSKIFLYQQIIFVIFLYSVSCRKSFQDETHISYQVSIMGPELTCLIFASFVTCLNHRNHMGEKNIIQVAVQTWQ